MWRVAITMNSESDAYPQTGHPTSDETPLEKFVRELSDDTKIEVLRNYEELRTTGQIGACALRNLAKEFSDSVGSNGYATLWMDTLVFEIMRQYVKPLIERYPYGSLI